MSSFSIPIGNQVKHAEILSQQPVWEDFSSPEPNITGDEDQPTASPVEEEKMLISEDILKEAEKEEYERGYNDGMDEGFNSGKEAGRLEIQPQSQLLENLIKSYQDEKKSFYQENELFIVKLAIEIAKKIIHHELKQSPEILLYVVREALRRVTNNGRIIVKVNPDDIKMFNQFSKSMKDQISAFGSVEFISSKEILNGGCTIESESGIVDAQLDTQLEEIEKTLLEGKNA